MRLLDQQVCLLLHKSAIFVKQDRLKTFRIVTIWKGWRVVYIFAIRYHKVTYKGLPFITYKLHLAILRGLVPYTSVFYTCPTSVAEDESTGIVIFTEWLIFCQAFRHYMMALSLFKMPELLFVSITFPNSFL